MIQDPLWESNFKILQRNLETQRQLTQESLVKQK